MKAAIAILFACAAFSLLRAADPEPTTPMRIKEIPEKQLFCAKKEVKMAEVPAFTAETLPAIVRKATELRLGQNGPLMLTILGYQGDPSQSFTIEVNFPYWTKNDDYEGPYVYRTAPKFKCASLIYQGPISGTSAAWGKLVEAAIGAGHQPVAESRELFLNFENPESPNNVIELQLGID
jgi:effector-binding domain-containing protein